MKKGEFRLVLGDEQRKKSRRSKRGLCSGANHTQITIYNLFYFDKRISVDGSMTKFGLAGAVDSKITMYRTGVNKKI